MFTLPERGPLPEIALHNDRVMLRAWSDSPEELELVQRASTEPFIPQMTSIAADSSVADARDYIARQADRLVTRTGWPLVVVDAQGGACVGQIGVWIESLRHGRAEIGYWIEASHRRRGYAGQAVRLLSDWSFENLGVHRLSLFIEPWNVGSIGTAESSGYENEGLLKSWQFVGGEPRDMLSFARFAS